MPRDNVTPFRRPKPKRPQGEGIGLATRRGKAVLVQALTLLTFALMYVFPVIPYSLIPLAPGIAAVAIAVSNRAEPLPWARTHFEHALRTILIGYSIWTLSIVILGIFGPLAMIIPIIKIAVLIWVVVRAGVGLVLAVMRRPIWRPTGILF